MPLQNIKATASRDGDLAKVAPPCVYTVSRVRSDDVTLFGKVHGSSDGNTTICGKTEPKDGWYIVSNAFDGEITCKECLKIAVA